MSVLILEPHTFNRMGGEPGHGCDLVTRELQRHNCAVQTFHGRDANQRKLHHEEAFRRLREEADLGSVHSVVLGNTNWFGNRTYGNYPTENLLKAGISPGTIVVYSPWWDELVSEFQNLGIPRENLYNRHATLSGDIAKKVLSFPPRREPDEEVPDSPSARVVLAIRTLALELCKCIADAPEALWSIDWLKLEEVVAFALEGIGFDIELTPPAKDGGKDIVVRCRLNGEQQTYYVELKHWRSGKQVGPKVICDFVAINAKAATHGGLLISTSGFSGAVFAELPRVLQRHIRLSQSDKVVSLCRYFVRHMNGLWAPSEIPTPVLFEDTLGL